MSATEPVEADRLLLALFEGAGPVETPTPGIRAWLANDVVGEERRPVLIKRVGNAGKGRATEALSLLHPHIVRTRRWMTEGGYLYVVRDVVRGKNLRQLLGVSSATRPSPELLRRLLMPLLDALEFAHARGAEHGGVSPENLLVTDAGHIWISDFATADPKAPHHFNAYHGEATVKGDIRATAGMISAYLPTSGPFATSVVRGRIEGLLNRCDTVNDLRETLLALEKLAAAAVPTGSPATAGRGGSNTPTAAAAPVRTPSAAPAPSRAPAGVNDPKPPWDQSRYNRTFPNDAPTLTGAPELICTLAEPAPRLPQGGGGATSLVIRNDGSAPLIIRMIATQHAWLNVRPTELPLTILPNQSERVGFHISAARLTPGEYRSEVYLSSNAGGRGAEGLQDGWFKHTCEVRIIVELPGRGAPAAPPRAARRW